MSCWTHITACLSIDTDCIANRRELMRQIKINLDNAPLITGSEQNADIFINIPSGYNCMISHDCDHCKYGDTHKEYTRHGKAYESCDSPEGYTCKNSHYQTCAVISIQGDLRDRMKSETQREFDKFLRYIKKTYYVRDYSLNIEGDY